MSDDKKKPMDTPEEQTPASKSPQQEVRRGGATVVGYLPSDHKVYSTSRILFGAKPRRKGTDDGKK